MQQNVYIVGGLAGMGKTSRILPGLHAKKPGLCEIELDYIRGITTGLLTSEGFGVGSMGFEGKTIFTQAKKSGNQIKEFSIQNKGEDYFAWLSVFGLIKRIDQDVVIAGVFNSIILTPQNVRDLELARPEIKFRAAFVGYNRKARDARPEKIKLKYNDYDDVTGSNNLKKQTENLGLPNYQYFDLIESVPEERSNKDIVLLEQIDFDNNAEKVVKHLLRK